VNEHDSCQQTQLRRRQQAAGFRIQQRSGFYSCDSMIAGYLGQATERTDIRNGLQGQALYAVLASLKM
jgi:hypothetical protein